LTASYQGPLFSIVHRSIVAAGCVSLVFAAVNLPKCLEVPGVLLGLGRISYGIYLWHGVLLLAVMPNVEIVAPVAIKAALALAMTLLLAVITYHAVERPAQRWIQTMFRASGERYG
jgi:peptidoglycan/LPS O-acetylase OafA/YrhL